MKIVKVPLHIIPLFLNSQEVFAYAEFFDENVFNYIKGLETLPAKDIHFNFLLNFLRNFRRVETVTDTFEFTIKGDVLTFLPPGYEYPIKIEFFGDNPEKMYLVSKETGRKINELQSIFINPTYQFTDESRVMLDSIKILNPIVEASNVLNKIIFTPKDISINDSEVEYIRTDFTFPSLFFSNFKLLEQEVDTLQNNGYKVMIVTKHKQEVPKSLKRFILNSLDINFQIKDTQVLLSPSPTTFTPTTIPAGFISESMKLAVFTDRELFGTVQLKSKSGTLSQVNIQKLLRQLEGDIEVGNYIVHEDYGVAIYSGFKQETVDGVQMDYLHLKYAEGDELYVPLHQINKITKYIGPDDIEPRLTRLGKITWEHLKEKIHVSTREVAKELIEHYAKRSLSKAKPIVNEDTVEYHQFVKEFKHKETTDQEKTINEVIADLGSEMPMNRLVVGDVGFGKTEVIMRAAFKIVENGGQVAVLAPTTILTAQHLSVFTQRFKNTKFKIASVSRFNSEYENKKIIEDLNEGEIDIIIGTHRLLSNDVFFKNLELLVVDEEQRFGVKQKEKVKRLNYGVHVLSVSATPIPRTLSMALSAIQDISVIATPPLGRKSIYTEIVKNDWNKVTKAINFEVERGGQVYFVHNEVLSIHSIKHKLETLLPKIRFVFAHGQMSSDELDTIMTDFYSNKYDCLISTTIIENGLDLPNVNTIIVNNAQRFGLSQLYQLRGRVGRSEREAFCYLFYQGTKLDDEVLDIKLDETKKPVNRKYLDRLQSLVDNQDLGAGFRIASRDLEIRGAGTLLGEKQHGYMSTVGYALYLQILAEEVEKLKELYKASGQVEEGQSTFISKIKN